MTDDIVINEVIVSDMISVKFSLNQEKTFSDGQVVNVRFLFELVEVTLGTYSASNPIDINSATSQELMNIGFTNEEANNTLAAGGSTPFANISELAIRIGSPTIVDRYQEYENVGVVVFN